MKKPELLCPVGGKDTLDAALRGGADAVYFGGKAFNARMNAKNFTPDEIREAVLTCHGRGVKVYITANTLLTDRELPGGLDFVSSLYEMGVDALIVADLGLASLIRESFPDFELHASTQMSGHSVGAACFLKEKGFSRMVLAREMTKSNIELLCRQAPIETELFVHGALCASASGQCLMSSMIGDRSGNRGECAQPCRLPYNGGYPLSLKDLCLAGHIEEILSLGVSSLKIEGRMKSPDYVYATARTWRTLLDEGRCATEREISYLSRIFSRSGFTDGYFTAKRDKTMLGTRTEQDKAKTEKEKIRFTDCGARSEAISLSRESKAPLPLEKPPKEKCRFCRSAVFQQAKQIPDGNFFKEIYLPLHRFDGTKANGVLLPAVIFPDEEKDIRLLLKEAREQGAAHALVGNLGHFRLLEGLDFTIHGDFRLNVQNSFTLKQLPSMEDVIVSPELNGAKMRDIRGKKRVIVYGRLPLMLLEKQVGCTSLCDRRGVIFPVEREGRRDVVFNSVPFYMADRKKDLKDKELENQHFIFTTETKKQVEDIILAFREGRKADFPFKRIP